MLAKLQEFAKARLPFIIATGGEFIALYFWLFFFDQRSFLLATAVLWFGFMVERVAVLYWVRENFGKEVGIGADSKPWWQKLIGLLLICLSEITVWVAFALTYDWLGIWPAFVVLFVGEQIEHSVELGLLSKSSPLKFMFSASATVITVLEALGGIAWMYLVRNDQPQLGGAMMLLGLTVEHVIQGNAIKKKFLAKKKALEAKEPSGTVDGARETDGTGETDEPDAVDPESSLLDQDDSTLLPAMPAAIVGTEQNPQKESLLSPAPVIGGAIAVAAAMGLMYFLQPLCFQLVKPQPADATITHLDQNWTVDQRSQFYHASQGTVLMKKEWFLALEQPYVQFVGGLGMMADQDYLSRFGFLADEKSDWNPYDLPVGFAISNVEMPDSGLEQEVVGITCAACHTGEIHVGDQRIRIDGGTALIDITQFQNAVGAAFLLTSKIPTRFARFADRVLGEDRTADQTNQLAEEMDDLLRQGIAEKNAAAKRQIYDGHDGGYGRTDALAKIGNFVFGTELNDDNLRIGSAPVRFPPIWDTPWFDWTQYNGSIEQPMVRNIGEALGVRARVNLDPESERYLHSTVDIEGLISIEKTLAGEEPLQGLHSPQWPNALGAINHIKARNGEELYRDLCIDCHLPPLHSDEIWDSKYWISNQAPSMVGPWEPPAEEHRYLNLLGVNLGKIGTDPGQATNFFKRYVNTGDSVLPSVTQGMHVEGDWEKADWYKHVSPESNREFAETMLPVGVALQKLTVSIAERYYDKKGWDRAERDKANGYRNPAARNPLEYRPRPLNGIWASPPYLHNGSVRTIYQLLSPQSERDVVFHVGSRQYDPEHLGYRDIKERGTFVYDTTVDGNLNVGHEFKNAALGNGVIGPLLSHEERMQIIEFLKTIGPAVPAVKP